MTKQLNRPKTFLDELTPEYQRILIHAGTPVTIKSGKILFQEGDHLDQIFLIRSGKVKISKLTEDGREMTLHLKEAGELVGDGTLFSQLSIRVNAQALGDLDLLAYSHKGLETLFEQHGQLATAYIKWQSREAQVNEAKFRDLILFGKTGALYSTLIRFSNTHGKQVEEGILIDLRLTNQDLANYIGTTRENVNRLLNDLRQGNIIRLEKGYMTILNLEFLKKYLQCGDCPIDICKI